MGNAFLMRNGFPAINTLALDLDDACFGVWMCDRLLTIRLKEDAGSENGVVKSGQQRTGVEGPLEKAFLVIADGFSKCRVK
ncbi:hypothetical protein Ct61P_08485 [Colletotrichum tofieldiae]|nr:hypothetical protein Ct61P_08485 [Colletotrichum tofieldiae]